MLSPKWSRRPPFLCAAKPDPSVVWEKAHVKVQLPVRGHRAHSAKERRYRGTSGPNSSRAMIGTSSLLLRTLLPPCHARAGVGHWQPWDRLHSNKRSVSLLNSEDTHSYKNDYSRFLRVGEIGCIYMIPLVGAGRFERPTPCAQGRCATRLRYAPTGVALLILQ